MLGAVNVFFIIYLLSQITEEKAFISNKRWLVTKWFISIQYNMALFQKFLSLFNFCNDNWKQ